MCTFENGQSIVVCDIAIGKVRETRRQAFGDAVQFTPVKGTGTRVEASPSVDTAAFQEATRQAIAAAQRKNITSNQ